MLIRMNSNLITELLAKISPTEVKHIIDIVRFLSLHEMDLITHSMSIMTIRVMNHL